VHYAWKVAEKGFKMVFMMNKLTMINSCEIILENFFNCFFAKNHCEIEVRTILVCTLNSIKYRNDFIFRWVHATNVVDGLSVTVTNEFI
jgi:hypothetical protein